VSLQCIILKVVSIRLSRTHPKASSKFEITESYLTDRSWWL